MPFIDNNVTAGVSAKANYRVGRANSDNNAELEYGINLPWLSSATGSYLYYDCSIACMLDSGAVVHNALPQVNKDYDTLSTVFLEEQGVDKYIDRHINLKSNDQFQDAVQRMAHSRYWFVLWGQALRVGYRVPIPGVKVIAGVPAIPFDAEPQLAYNRILPGANYSGIPVWHAEWRLWYTTAVPPTSNTIPSIDSAGHISGAQPLPSAIKTPWSDADDNAVSSSLTPGGPVQ